MEYEWEKYQDFTDEVGTRFIKLNDNEYQFITSEEDEDIATKQQLIDWKIQVITYKK